MNESLIASRSANIQEREGLAGPLEGAPSRSHRCNRVTAMEGPIVPQLGAWRALSSRSRHLFQPQVT